MVERVLQKLAVLSVRWRRFHGAEKIRNIRETVTVSVRNLTVCVCYVQAFTEWSTTASRQTDRQRER